MRIRRGYDADMARTRHGHDADTTQSREEHDDGTTMGRRGHDYDDDDDSDNHDNKYHGYGNCLYNFHYGIVICNTKIRISHLRLCRNSISSLPMFRSSRPTHPDVVILLRTKQ